MAQAEHRLGLKEKVKELDKLEIKTKSTEKERREMWDTTHKSNLNKVIDEGEASQVSGKDQLIKLLMCVSPPFRNDLCSTRLVLNLGTPL